MITAGVDVGSLSAEAVILSDGALLAAEIIRVRPSPVESSSTVMSRALEVAGLCLDDIDACISTGYGRDNIPFANKSMSEISCHGKGAYWCDASIRTIVDIGGQDCKAITVDENGDLVDFKMNEKCAAGTGRFLEIISKALGVELEALGPLSFQTETPLKIVNRCSVFAEYETLFLLAEGKSIVEIGAGVNEAMAQRAFALAHGLKTDGGFTVTGGVAKNVGVIRSLETLFETEVIKLPVDPQIIGALGAAVLAERLVESQGARE